MLIAAWGPLLGLGSYGLGRLLQVERPSWMAQAGLLLNFTAGALVTSMLLVQIAVRHDPTAAVPRQIQAVWLGLDVAWDDYIGLGTAFLALAMWRHPRPGPAFTLSGIAIAIVLLFLNLLTFPNPPADAGYFDAGPLVGLWYLAVSIRAGVSLTWTATRLGHAQTASARD